MRAVFGVCLLIAVGVSAIGCDSESGANDTLARCPTPIGDGIGSPATIAEALALMNALPGPVDVPCVLEALDRPLSVRATTSGASAQPAVGLDDPRIFIFTDGLTLTFATGGNGTYLLEFGEIVNDRESIKGELHMPAVGPIGLGKPFEHLRFRDSKTTSCGLCHQGERAAGVGSESGDAELADFELAKVSPAFRPRDHELVGLDTLREARRSCEDDSRRCQILRAIFDHGPVVEGRFPESWPTFFAQ